MQKIHRGFVVTGSALLLVALLLFIYFIAYRPTQQHPEFEAHINNPVIPTSSSASGPTPRTQQTLQVDQTPTSRKKQFHHLSSAPEQTPTSAEKKPGFFRRFLDLIKRLFGRRSKTGGAKPPLILHGPQPSTSSLRRACPLGSTQSCDISKSEKIQLTAAATATGNSTLLYTWSVTGGRIIGEGSSVTWDLSGVANGDYIATVSVSDGTSKVDGRTSVTVSDCVGCIEAMIVCPIISVHSPDRVAEGEPITFSADIPPELSNSVTYNWNISKGKIISGDRTSKLTVDSAGLGETTITATVVIGRLPPSCTNSADKSTDVIVQHHPPPFPRSIMEYGPITINDEKARLDTFAVEWQNDPTTKVAIVAYGTCQGDDVKRAARARDYLVSNRGLDPGRATIIPGGCREQPSTQLWLVPTGAGMPAPNTEGLISPCPQCSATLTKNDKPRATLIGRVTDKDGAPLPDATVTLIGENKFRKAGKTDSSGEFQFQDVPAGKYNLEIASAGLGMRKVEDVEVKEGANILPEPIQVFEKEVTTRFKLRDVIRISYPDHFIESPAGEITFEWNREQRASEVVTSQTNTNGRIDVIDRPLPVPGGTPDVPVTEAHGAQYTAFARVSLVSDGLTVVSSPPEPEQSLAPSHVSWNWKVKPADMNAQLASFSFRIDLVWRGKDLPEQTQSYPWQKTFIARVGPPGSVTAAKYGSPTCAFLGLVTFGFGFRKRKLLGASMPAEEAASPAPAVRAAVTEEMAEDVSSSVFAPRRAAPGEGFLVQVFAHPPAEDPATLNEKATEAQPGAEKVGGDLLDQQVRRGTTLTFSLMMKGLEIDEPQQDRVWRGRTVGVQFGVTVPENFKLGSLYGVVVISADTVPIGHFRFAFEVVAAGTHAAETPAYLGALTRYQHAFISYAHQDRAEVLKRVQMLNILKEKYFQDFISLDPGMNGEPAIREAIVKSAVIFLFWSRAASGSVEVKKEILYAMARRHGDENALPAIHPVIIEGPPPPAPPAELRFLQFDDKFSYWIFAAEATAKPEKGN